MLRNRLNKIFNGMKKRCYNTNERSYKNYGGRGITICDEWMNSEMFDWRTTKGYVAFKQWALSSGYEEGLTIDRIDVNKGYSPENCRWVTMKVQANNTTRNHFVTYKGRTQTLKQWCDELGLNYKKTNLRIVRYKWSVEKAFSIGGNARYRVIEYKGKSQSLASWCRELGLEYSKICARINHCHWTIEKAFNTK